MKITDRKERIRKLKARITEITIELLKGSMSRDLAQEHTDLSMELELVRKNVHSSKFFEWIPNKLPNRRQKREYLKAMSKKRKVQP